MPYHIQKYHLPSTSQDIDEFQGTILTQIKNTNFTTAMHLTLVHIDSQTAR